MQHITIAGRIAADATTRSVQNNDVTEVRLAVDQGFGDKKVTNWYRVNIWGKKGANAAQYLTKGGQITVVGELSIGEYNGKPTYDVRASDFTLPARQGGNGRPRNTDSGRSGGFGKGQEGHIPGWDDDGSEPPF